MESTNGYSIHSEKYYQQLQLLAKAGDILPKNW